MGREDGPGLQSSQASLNFPRRRRLPMPVTSRPSKYNLRSLGDAPVVEAQEQVPAASELEPVESAK